MKDFFSKIKKHSLLTCFFIFILGFAIGNLVNKDRNFSDMENRYLQQRPKFTIKSFIKNEYSKKYEQYINDQFILRDSFINIKMLSEVLFLKSENNNILIGDDNYLFDKLKEIDSKKINKNLSSISSFANKACAKKLYFSLVPNSCEILKDKLPLGFIGIDQREYIDEIYKNLSEKNIGLKCIDSFRFLEGKSDQIYYCLDHHWTTRGAYYFYAGLSEQLNFNPIDIKERKANRIKDFYGTYYSRAKIFWKQPDEILYYDFPIKSITLDGKKSEGLYDKSKFEKKDKYSAFLHGNFGLTVIDTDWKADKKDNICIIKDSYANSLVPFLTCNYNKIYVLDLRYIKKEDLKNFFKNEEIEEILIIYNFINFISDQSMHKLDF